MTDVDNNINVVSNDLGYNIQDTMDVVNDLHSLAYSFYKLNLSDRVQKVIDSTIDTIINNVKIDDVDSANSVFNDLLDYFDLVY